MKRFWVCTAGLTGLVALILFFFAPVFRGEIILNPILQVGILNLHYYGLILGAAVVASYAMARSNAWRFGVSKEAVDKYVFWAVLASFISARIYYVIFDFGFFAQNPAEIFQIWEGGLSIYGAIIGGLLFTVIYARNKAYSAWQLLDLAALALPVGQAIGRLGNFVNYEAYGRATDLPWKMFVPSEFRYSTLEQFYHPTFLYEAIGSLILFAILFNLRGKLKSGNLALCYLIGYSAIRFAVESFRVDSVFIGAFRADQLTAILVFAMAGLALLHRSKIQQQKT